MNWALSLKFRRIGPRGPKKGAVAQVSTNWDRQRDENPNIDGNSGASRFSLPVWECSSSFRRTAAAGEALRGVKLKAKLTHCFICRRVARWDERASQLSTDVGCSANCEFCCASKLLAPLSNYRARFGDSLDAREFCIVRRLPWSPATSLVERSRHAVTSGFALCVQCTKPLNRTRFVTRHTTRGSKTPC